MNRIKTKALLKPGIPRTIALSGQRPSWKRVRAALARALWPIEATTSPSCRPLPPPRTLCWTGRRTAGEVEFFFQSQRRDLRRRPGNCSEQLHREIGTILRRKPEALAAVDTACGKFSKAPSLTGRIARAAHAAADDHSAAYERINAARRERVQRDHRFSVPGRYPYPCRRRTSVCGTTVRKVGRGAGTPQAGSRCAGH